MEHIQVERSRSKSSLAQRASAPSESEDLSLPLIQQIWIPDRKSTILLVHLKCSKILLVECSSNCFELRLSMLRLEWKNEGIPQIAHRLPLHWLLQKQALAQHLSTKNYWSRRNIFNSSRFKWYLIYGHFPFQVHYITSRNLGPRSLLRRGYIHETNGAAQEGDSLRCGRPCRTACAVRVLIIADFRITCCGRLWITYSSFNGGYVFAKKLGHPV